MEFVTKTTKRCIHRHPDGKKCTGERFTRSFGIFQFPLFGIMNDESEKYCREHLHKTPMGERLVFQRFLIWIFVLWYYPQWLEIFLYQISGVCKNIVTKESGNPLDWCYEEYYSGNFSGSDLDFIIMTAGLISIFFVSLWVWLPVISGRSYAKKFIARDNFRNWIENRIGGTDSILDLLFLGGSEDSPKVRRPPDPFSSTRREMKSLKRKKKKIGLNINEEEELKSHITFLNENWLEHKYQEKLEEYRKFKRNEITADDFLKNTNPLKYGGTGSSSKGSGSGLLKTIAGATVGGLIGGPLGIVAGIAIANDPSVEWGESQNDDS